jgi:hypothetical protein
MHFKVFKSIILKYQDFIKICVKVAMNPSKIKIVTGRRKRRI